MSTKAIGGRDGERENRITTRRTYSDAFKAQVMAECEEPGASVAKVAMSHGINDNVVHPLAPTGARRWGSGGTGAAQ